MSPARFERPAEQTAHCRSMLDSCRVEDCLVLIRELQARQEELARQKKHLGQADSQYLKLAEKLICEEFSVALDTTPELIRARLYAVAARRATA